MSEFNAATRGRSRRLRSRYLMAAAAVAAMLASLLVFMSPAGAQQSGFHVQGRNLLDANGNTFVMRGSTHPFQWYQGQTNAIRDISNLGANTIRVVLSSGHRGGGAASQQQVADIIAQCKQHQVVCVLEVHDTTGYGEEPGAATLAQAVEYWNSIKGALVGQERYVLINIGNEPIGNDNPGQWTQATANAIRQMRDHGFTHALVVDAPNWGQDWTNTMRDNAPQVFNADPQRNTVFSVHMYEVYGSASTVTGYFSAFQQMNLPLIVGEYGNEHFGQPVAWQTVQSEAQARGIGWIAWSWSGNGGGTENLDQTVGFDPNQLTQWGQQVFNSQYGIKNTSERASVFGPDDPAEDGAIVGAGSNRCVDVPGSTTANGTQVQLWDCSGNANQSWTHSSSGELRVYGNKCLDAEGNGTADGTKAIIWDCHGGTNQRWHVNSDGSITNVHNGKCLDANNRGSVNGTQIILWTCNGGSNQQWRLTGLHLWCRHRRPMRRGPG
jgi:mannan endo-1,4-beta-mannosidase